MDAEKLKLLQKLQTLDYEIHACQQTLKLFQLNGQANPELVDHLISEQQVQCKQLQDQYDTIADHLSELS